MHSTVRTALVVRNGFNSSRPRTVSLTHFRPFIICYGIRGYDKTRAPTTTTTVALHTRTKILHNDFIFFLRFLRSLPPINVRTRVTWKPVRRNALASERIAQTGEWGCCGSGFKRQHRYARRTFSIQNRFPISVRRETIEYNERGFVATKIKKKKITETYIFVLSAKHRTGEIFKEENGKEKSFFFFFEQRRSYKLLHEMFDY